ncbi:MAG: ribosome maturation factor RimM [Cyclobacteriaceae bacterium]
MRLDDCFQLGKVIKPNGLKGKVSVFLDTDNPEYYSNMESVFVLIQNKLVPFFIESLEPRGDHAVIKFEGINSHEDADSLRDAGIYLPLEILPPLEGTSFYFHEIVGFDVVDEHGNLIGKVSSVYDTGPQDLLSVMHGEKEILIPIHDDIIKRIDREHKQIEAHLPDGLVSLYLHVT